MMYSVTTTLWTITVNYSQRSCTVHIQAGLLFWFHLSVLSSKLRQQQERRTRQNKTAKTEQIIFPLHIIYLTEGSKRSWKKIEKTGGKKIWACLPIFHLSCAHPSSVHLLIWSCHRLGNRDLQPLETNDPVRGGGATTHSQRCNTTLLMGFTLWYRSGLETLGILVFERIYLIIQDKFSGQALCRWTLSEKFTKPHPLFPCLWSLLFTITKVSDLPKFEILYNIWDNDSLISDRGRQKQPLMSNHLKWWLSLANSFS